MNINPIDRKMAATVTVDDLLSWKPCHSEAKIRDIAGNKQEWTAMEILALEHVLPEDRLWVVLRPELIDEPVLHELACRFAERMLPAWESQYPTDTRPHAAIAAKRAWLHGEISDKELSVARAAAECQWQVECVRELLMG